MRSTRFAVLLLLACAACSKDSAPAPSSPTPASTRVIRLGGNLSFGDVLVGEVRTDGALVINNDGDTVLTVSGITSPNSSIYTLSWTSGTIPPRTSQTVAVRFAPTAEMSYSGTLTVTGDQTSGINTIAVVGTGTRPPRRGTVTDPSRDAQPYPSVASPDLVGATIEVSGGILTVTVSLAPGTLVPSDTYCYVFLDADENPATGDTGIDVLRNDAGLMGTDYRIDFVTPRGSSRGLIGRWTPERNPQSFVITGRADVTFPSADQMRIAFPLTLLDNDDGRLAFKVGSAQWIDFTSGPNFRVDVMPNIGVAPGVTR